jgi:hypothetical protein
MMRYLIAYELALRRESRFAVAKDQSPSHDQKSDLEDRSTKYPGPTARKDRHPSTAGHAAGVGHANEAAPHDSHGSLIFS